MISRTIMPLCQLRKFSRKNFEMIPDLQEIKDTSLRIKVNKHSCKLLQKDTKIAMFQSKLTIHNPAIKMKAYLENIQSNLNKFQTAQKVPQKSPNDFKA
jgi:hypothetical protein